MGKFEHRDTHTVGRLYEDESRDQGNSSTSQGMSMIASKPQEARQEA